MSTGEPVVPSNVPPAFTPGGVAPNPPIPMSGNTKRISMQQTKICKHSVVYSDPASDICESIYVKKSAFAVMPQRIILEITPQQA